MGTAACVLVKALMCVVFLNSCVGWSKLSFNPGKRLWVMFEKILSVYSFITTDAVANIFFIHRNSPEF